MSIHGIMRACAERNIGVGVCRCDVVALSWQHRGREAEVGVRQDDTAGGGEETACARHDQPDETAVQATAGTQPAASRAPEADCEGTHS